MRDENSIRNLGDYSKPSHEGYRNTIELPVGNNVVPLRSDTIRLVQNGCSFYGLRSEDPNQHLKDFLKLVDSLDLDGSITTWEDLTTRFLTQFFPPGRTAKLRNDILMFQQRHGESLSEAWTRPSPQSQSLEITFEARVKDYMAVQSERMERFKNAIFKQHEEINDRMTKMFGLLKELTTSRAPEKVLIREEAKFPVTKNVNSISLARGEEERSDKKNETLDNTDERKEVEEVLSSRPVEYYLKHRINEKLIEGLVDNNRFNDSLSRARVGKVKGKTYNVLPRGPVYEAILKKKITKKEDIGGNFEIPCSIGGLKHVNALVDQGSDVNVMPYSTYMKLTNERSAKTNIRLLLASHSYIYPLGIAEDVLVEERGTITFEKDDEKITFIMPHKMEASNHIYFKDINTDSIPPSVLESNDDRGKTYYSDSLTLGPEYREDESISKEIRRLMKLEKEDKRHKGELTIYLMRRILEVLRKFHWMILR
ncbi:MAK10-like protein [Tanacetum coccineum]